jgi:Bacterial Ig domain
VTAPRVLGQSLTDGQEVSGLVVWRVDTSGTPAKVEFWIDGELRGTDLQRPFTLGWDTAAEAPGEHLLEARAVGANGREARASLSVVVAAAPG